MPAPKPKQLTPSQIAEQFAFHGLDIDPNAPQATQRNSQARTTCPFCDKPDHFYLCVEGEKASCWDCKRCGLSGNLYTFLQLTYDRCVANTTDNLRKKLRDHRNERIGDRRNGPGIPSTAYEDFAWNSETDRWTLPLTNIDGSLCNLLSYDPTAEKPFLCPTPHLPLRVYNGRLLNPKSLAHYAAVVVCEGAWDAAALEWLLSHVPESREKDKYAVIGLCGANNQPEAEIAALRGQHVILAFDNDEAGEAGLNRIVANFKKHGAPESVRAIRWPSSLPKGYDLTDYISSKNDKPWMVWRDFLDGLIDVPLATTTEIKVADEPLPELHRTSFQSVLKDFTKSGVEMNPRIREGLAVALATVLAGRTKGDPVWTFLIGPPGSGKSLLLETLTGSEDYTHFATSFSSRSLISGFDLGGEDPSLLAKIVSPQKCLVVKDYTAVITLPYQDLETLYGLLRDAYDGSVTRPFGNGVVRNYSGYFSICAGVTPEIHTLSHAYLGERFLKYELASRTNLASDKMILAAIRSGSNCEADHEARRVRQASVKAFLDHCFEKLDKPLPAINDRALYRLVALAKSTSICRAKVKRDRNGLTMYDASPEEATRLGKQLVKLAQCLAVIFSKPKVDDTVLNLVAKVAWDTGYGRFRTAVEILNDHDKLAAADLQDAMDIPPSAAFGILRDLHDLGVVNRTKLAGKNKYTYRLSKTVQEILEKAKLGERSC